MRGLPAKDAVRFPLGVWGGAITRHPPPPFSLNPKAEPQYLTHSLNYNPQTLTPASSSQVLLRGKAAKVATPGKEGGKEAAKEGGGDQGMENAEKPEDEEHIYKEGECLIAGARPPTPSSRLSLSLFRSRSLPLSIYIHVYVCLFLCLYLCLCL